MMRSGTGRWKRWVLLATTVGGVALLLIWIYPWARNLDFERIEELVAGWNGPLVFALMVLLPVFGFPISPLFAVAGARFGTGLGLVLAGCAIAINLFLIYWLTETSFRNPLERWIRRRSRFRLPRIPAEEQVQVTLLVALLPAISYTVKNYLLALSRIRFRIYFSVCVLVHTAKASLAILVGDLFDQLTPVKIGLLVLYSIILTALCHHIVSRLRRRGFGRVFLDDAEREKRERAEVAEG